MWSKCLQIGPQVEFAQTKNDGVSWADRTPAAGPLDHIASIAVDPRNRDVAYIVNDGAPAPARAGCS